MANICTYFPECKACTSWNEAYSIQTANKISHLTENIQIQELKYSKKIDFISCGDYGLRHRVDFSLQYNSLLNKTEFGFYNEHHQIVPISGCMQMSPVLELAFQELIQFEFKTGDTFIKKASLRLRVGPTGLKGVWLDLANIDIKNLLDDGHLLQQLLSAGYVIEMGQKGKRVVLENIQFKLRDPKPEIWFQTGKNHLLKCLISDFTQPSWITAKKLTDTVVAWTDQIIKQTEHQIKLVEFGAGLGQFTVPFLLQNINVTALELEESQALSLKLNASLYTENLQIQIGDFHQNSITTKCDIIFVNPARSGLKKFVDSILDIQPKNLIYVSCFTESMLQDLNRLKHVYKVNEITIVDQFPQTKHYETCIWLSLLT